MTTAQQLGSIVKSARQIMRKDKGLSGELDRLPILTWVMFLKFLDDLERLRETEAVLQGKAFQPAIDPPYRWRDWAALEGGITGDELIAFINQEQAVLPDGSQGPGLFAYLRNLQGAREPTAPAATAATSSPPCSGACKTACSTATCCAT
jgi:type I restriction enzyme M protein